MDNTQIKQDIDNININVETPSDDSDTNLQELERDNWGRILNNKTFKVMKENFRLIKTSFNNFISNVSNEINTLVNKTNTIENNVNTIQTTVNELKVNGGKINESTLSTLANKETVNTFKEVNTFEKGIDSTLYKLNTNELANMQGETITIGDITKSINIIGKDTTLLYNGMEIKGGGSSGGYSGSDFFIGEYPLSTTIKRDSNDVPFLNTRYNATDLTSLKSNRNNFEHIYATGYNYGDFLRLLEFNKVEKTNIGSDLCFKMNLSGARNNLSSYNTISKITTYSDTYTVFYITNTRDLFEGDFTTVKIEFEVNNAKVLLKI